MMRRVLILASFGLAATLFLLLAGGAQPPPTSLHTPDGSSGCRWLGAKGEQLLERRLDRLSLADVRTEVAVAELSHRANLPMSFIMAEPEGTVTMDLQRPSVRQALNAIVASSGMRYRYALMAGRLLLYPTDPKWEMRVADIHLGPAPRLQATRELQGELRKRFSEFAALAGPWTSGDGDTYRDVVSVSGPASVADLLVQLLGDRPSVYFIVVKEDGWLGPSLSVCPRDQLSSLKITAPTTVIRHGEVAQLKVAGTLKYKDQSIDLTSGVCRTVYSVSDENVLSVSSDGLITARGNGEAVVKAMNEHSSDWVKIRVELPKTPEPPPAH